MTTARSDRQLDIAFPDDEHPNTAALRERRAADAGDLASRHRAEWDMHLDVWHDALFRRSEPLARLAKLLADTLKVRQAEERAATGGDGAPAMDPETRMRRIGELLKELGIARH